MYGESVFFFREKLKIQLLILDEHITWEKSTFSSHLAENLTVHYTFLITLGIRKSAHVHTRVLNIKSHLMWRLFISIQKLQIYAYF